MKLARRTLGVDPPGASSRTSAAAMLNPLREIHNHQPKIQHQQHATSTAPSASILIVDGKRHRHPRQSQQQQQQQQQQQPRRHKPKLQLAEKAGPIVYRHQRHHHPSRHAHAHASSKPTPTPLFQPEQQQQQQHVRSQRKRRVRFVQFYKNQKYDNPATIRPQDHDRLWYSSADIRAFQRAVKQEPLRLLHPHYTAWSNALHCVYHAFLALDNAQEIMAILEATPTEQVFHPAGLGMERRAIALVAEDAQSRRRQLLAAVAKCQAAPVPDPWLRAQMLREMCRTVSKPSRLYARHVAHMTAVAAAWD